MSTPVGAEEERTALETKYDSMVCCDEVAVTMDAARRFLGVGREVAVEDARCLFAGRRWGETAAGGCSSSVDASLSISMTVDAVLLLDDERRK